MIDKGIQNFRSVSRVSLREYVGPVVKNPDWSPLCCVVHFIRLYAYVLNTSLDVKRLYFEKASVI